MSSYNKVILVGNLTRDPEIRYTQSGTAVASFSLAVNNKYKQGDETKEDVCFIGIVFFGKQAETVAQYLEKGKSVLIEGRLNQSTWETDDGQKRSKHEVIAHAFKFMSAPSVAAGEKGGVPF